MTTKDIRKAIKSGQKVIFNRHISGSLSFERLPVLGVKEVHGATWVKFMWFNFRNHSTKPVWAAVQPDLDDYVSINFPPAQPVKFSEEAQ